MPEPKTIRILVELRSYESAESTRDRVRATLETHPTLSLRVDRVEVVGGEEGGGDAGA